MINDYSFHVGCSSLSYISLNDLYSVLKWVKFMDVVKIISEKLMNDAEMFHPTLFLKVERFQRSIQIKTHLDS